MDGPEPGDYEVCEVEKDGWVVTDGPCETVILQSGGKIDVDFGNYQPVTVIGYKFEDLNGDGVMDANEPWIEGWEMTLNGARSQYRR